MNLVERVMGDKILLTVIVIQLSVILLELSWLASWPYAPLSFLVAGGSLLIIALKFIRGEVLERWFSNGTYLHYSSISNRGFQTISHR